MKRNKRGNETVGDYLADLRRLMKTSGQKEAADGKDSMLMAQFLTSLPITFANQLRMSIAANSGGLTLMEVARQTRAIFAAVGTDEPELASFAAATSPSMVCYECRQTGHLRKNCPERKGKSCNRSKAQCYTCRGYGHFKHNCPQSSAAGKGNARPSAAVIEDKSRTSNLKNVCLGIAARTGIPQFRIYVMQNGHAKHVKAAIDSCPTRSLVAADAVKALNIGVALSPPNACITTIDDKSAKVAGVVSCSITQDDAVVYLPEITAQFLMVDSISVVSADLLVGLKVISSTGGVHLQYDEDGGVLTYIVFGPTVPQTAGCPAVGREEPSVAKTPHPSLILITLTHVRWARAPSAGLFGFSLYD